MFPSPHAHSITKNGISPMDYKIEWNEKYPDVILLCTDGEVAMSNGEFESLLDAGNILRHLVHRAPGMHAKASISTSSRTLS